jgi:hypothetical protein
MQSKMKPYFISLDYKAFKVSHKEQGKYTSGKDKQQEIEMIKRM